MAAAAEQIEATDAATQVVFKFPRAVSVDNGRTLSIPIIDRQVPAQRLALYQADTARAQSAGRDPPHQRRRHRPAARASSRSTSATRPACVSYVGDARLSAFPVGETRLLAYALDEKITIERDVAQTDRLATGTIANGVLRYRASCARPTTYRVRGPAKEPRQLVVVQRRLPGWTLTKPDAKGVELSEGNYRIPFQLPGGDQTQTFEVVQEQTQQQELRLVDSAADQIRVYAQAREFDAKTREALTRVLQLQQAVGEAQRKVAQVDAERQADRRRSRRACATTSRACRPTATCSAATSPRSTSRRPSSKPWPSAAPTPRRRRDGARRAADYVASWADAMIPRCVGRTLWCDLRSVEPRTGVIPSARGSCDQPARSVLTASSRRNR